MSVVSEIQILQQAKSDIKDAIKAAGGGELNGVSIDTVRLKDYPPYISALGVGDEFTGRLYTQRGTIEEMRRDNLKVSLQNWENYSYYYGNKCPKLVAVELVMPDSNSRYNPSTFSINSSDGELLIYAFIPTSPAIWEYTQSTGLNIQSSILFAKLETIYETNVVNGEPVQTEVGKKCKIIRRPSYTIGISNTYIDSSNIIHPPYIYISADSNSVNVYGTNLNNPNLEAYCIVTPDLS